MRINKKAVVAGGAAAVLLIGGGLTFARWYDEASLGNQAAEVKSGELSFAIDNLACQWANGGDNVAPGDLIAPGDTMQCTGSSQVVTNIKGKNLKATLSAVPTGKLAELVNDDFAVLKATVNGSTEPVALTAANDGDTFDVGFSIYFKEFKDSVDNSLNRDKPTTDTAQWWGEEKQNSDYSFNTGDIKLQLVQNDR
ncbi:MULTISPECIES: alternate-type signal peptide domain-containing protein [Brevibacterium]|uniref:Alternate-type signal peptide domain-containing protein n=2 Tax=Brevibacterium TaxID=1696 RepID=A0ABP9TY77_9MICO